MKRKLGAWTGDNTAGPSTPSSSASCSTSNDGRTMKRVTHDIKEEEGMIKKTSTLIVFKLTTAYTLKILFDGQRKLLSEQRQLAHPQGNGPVKQQMPHEQLMCYDCGREFSCSDDNHCTNCGNTVCEVCSMTQ